MKSKCLFAVFLAFSLIVAVSCTKEEFYVDGIQVQPYVRLDGTMGLSLYVMVSDPDENAVQFTVKNPDGSLTWSFKASRVSYSGQKYLGNSDISMPSGMRLPTGLWTMDVMYKDGTTITRKFDVDYGNVSAALKHYDDLSNAPKVWFDSEEDLTVVDK